MTFGVSSVNSLTTSEDVVFATFETTIWRQLEAMTSSAYILEGMVLVVEMFNKTVQSGNCVSTIHLLSDISCN